MRFKTFYAVLLLTVLGGVLRFYQIDKLPQSLNVDEVSIGYNAYSILKTGHDEFGNFLPLSIRSLGDYKPPVYIYLTALSEQIFGLNEFSVRFPSAFFGMLSIPLFYFFFLQFTKDKKAALLGTLLISISPWHIYFSRVASEAQVATFLLVLGFLFLQKVMNGKKVWAVLAALFLILSMYTYHSERLFVPLIVFAFLVLNKKQLLRSRAQLLVFVFTSVLLASPLAYSMIAGPDGTRAQMTIITHDPDYIRYTLAKSVTDITGIPAVINSLFGGDAGTLFFYWARKLLAYFQPSFLFVNGLGLTLKGSYGLGILYLFELPFLILGIITLIREKMPNRLLVGLWVFLGLIPASLTMNEQHPIRTLVILPMSILVSAIGGVAFFKLVNNNFGSIQRKFTYALLGCFVFWNLSQAFLIYTVHMPRQKGEGFMEGTKETVQYALQNKDKYKEIVFDPVRGVEGPYIVSVPHVYILFYSQYDPAKYLSEPKIMQGETFKFDKFTVRPIDWRTDRAKEGTLFIGSPWSLPEKDVKEEEILKRIYLTNGQLAFLIVTPKPH